MKLLIKFTIPISFTVLAFAIYINYQSGKALEKAVLVNYQAEKTLEEVEELLIRVSRQDTI